MKEFGFEICQIEIPRYIRKSDNVDATKFDKFVPRFLEHRVNEYFSQSEAVARNLKWSEQYRTTLLQWALLSKSHAVQSEMPIELTSDYGLVKESILRACDLMPQGKTSDISRSEIVKLIQMVAMFDRWCTAKEVGQDNERLMQLMMIEEFKYCVPNYNQTYIDEQNIDTVDEVSRMADEYALTPKESRQRNYENGRGNPGGHSQIKNIDTQVSGINIPLEVLLHIM